MIAKTYVQDHSDANFRMMTPYGYVDLTADQVQEFLEGCNVNAHPGESGCAITINSEKVWELTDDDCAQYIKKIAFGCAECVQIVYLPEDKYGVARQLVDIREYSEHEIEEEIKPFGYKMSELSATYSAEDLSGLIIECVFENHALSCLDELIFDSFEAANNHVQMVINCTQDVDN